jgi:hypothetical protein
VAAEGGHDPELELWWQLVRDRYGSRLSETEVADLRRVVEGIVAGVRQIRAVQLSNADAPIDVAVTWRQGQRRPT